MEKSQRNCAFVGINCQRYINVVAIPAVCHEILTFQQLGFMESDKKVQCKACSHFCVIDEGKAGFCGVRKNLEGKLVSLVCGKALTKTIDPLT